MSKEISLTQGAVAIVADEDYDWLSKWTWRLSTGGYAVRNQSSYARIYMHREILEAPSDMEADHINHDRLDNRRANLRLCTHAQNAMNTTKRPSRAGRKSTYRYKGVSWEKRRGRWAVQICKDYERFYLGRFESEEDAARAYNAAARELFGEFASLNEISS